MLLQKKVVEMLVGLFAACVPFVFVVQILLAEVTNVREIVSHCCIRGKFALCQAFD
jgi:hypothetical protein